MQKEKYLSKTKQTNGIYQMFPFSHYHQLIKILIDKCFFSHVIFVVEHPFFCINTDERKI